MAQLQNTEQQNNNATRFGGTMASNFLTEEQIAKAKEYNIPLPQFQTQRLQVPTQSNNNVSWFDAWATKPMSSQEQQKRAKAANTINMLGHLGMAFAGLGNVLATGKGAKAVNMPIVPDTNISAYRDKWRGEEQEYLKGRMTAQKADRDEYLNQLRMYVQDKSNVDKANRYIAGQFGKSITDMMTAEKKAQDAKDLEATRAENEEKLENKRQQNRIVIQGMRNANSTRNNSNRTTNTLTPQELTEANRLGISVSYTDDLGVQRQRPSAAVRTEIIRKRKQSKK